MDSVIQSLEWSLEGSDRDIQHCWDNVQYQVKSLIRAEEDLKKRLDEYTRALTFKEEARQALEILRAAK